MNTVQKYQNPQAVYNQNEFDITQSVQIYGDEDIYNTEEFKLFLQRVEANYFPTLYEFSINEPRIEIDLDNRAILIEDYYQTLDGRNFLAMEKDHRSQTIYFVVDRYFEDVDLLNCTCIIEYINAGNHARVYPVTVKHLLTEMKADQGETERIVLAWCLSNEVTMFPGTIKFSIMFYRMAYETDVSGNVFNCELLYALHTQPVESQILKGLNYSENQKNELEAIQGVAESNYQAILEQIRQKNVYWNDL